MVVYGLSCDFKVLGCSILILLCGREVGWDGGRRRGLFVLEGGGGHRQRPGGRRRGSGQGLQQESHHRAREKTISQPLILRLTDTADADLAEIWSYLASEASEQIAGEVIDQIENKFGALLAAPFMGSPRRQLGVGLRVVLRFPCPEAPSQAPNPGAAARSGTAELSQRSAVLMPV